MAITSVGTGSGLDLENLIKDIVNAERTPAKNRLDLKATRIEASISALGSLRSTLADFQASLTKLRSASNFSARSALSGDTTLFTATANSSAELGSYRIEVLQMAKASKLASADFSGPTAVVGSGSLTISSGSNSFDVQIDAGVNDTLAGIRDAINNATGNSSVRASILTVSDGNGGTASKLVLTARNSGAANAISVTATGDADGNDTDNAGLSQLATANLIVVDAAQDARITIDGFEATSTTNTFTNAISGVTLNILKEGSDPLAPLGSSLDVAIDRSGVKSSIEGFVANYNALVTIFNTLTNYDRATNTRGLLSGDASVNVMESRIRAVMASTVDEAATGMNSLAFLGISTNRDGSIALNDQTLTNALNNRFEDLGALFSGDNGIASRLDRLITEFTGAGGIFATRDESLRNQLRDIDAQRDKLNLRLEKIEARYRAQFSALDILVGQLQQTGDFLLQQLEATAQIINRKNK